MSFPARAPCAVRGLDSAAAFVTLSLAIDDFDRARLDVGRRPGGRMPLPTLAENNEVDEDAEVSLELFELLR